mmetsp:Transcript_7372/g.29046  ORF Transcript_7372/g.29046 Transcript_7372/m.29046 type:complete len:224 (+) Transcript_7372:2616-3287(+)
MAHAVRVAQHRDLGVIADVGDEGVGPAGDDEVHDVVQREDVRDGFATLDEDDALAGDAKGGHAVDDDLVEDGVGLRRLLATLEEEAVAGSDGEGGDLREGVGPGLEDDQEDSEGRGDLLEGESVRHLHLAELAAERLLHVGDLPGARRELRDLPGLHLEPVEEVRLGVGSLGGGDVLLVLAHDGVLVGLEGVGDRVQQRGAILAAEVLELPAGVACRHGLVAG